MLGRVLDSCLTPSHTLRAMLPMLYAMPTLPHTLLTRSLQVKIMRDYDPTGKLGPSKRLPDVVVVEDPKEEEVLTYSGYEPKPAYGKEDIPAAPLA